MATITEKKNEMIQKLRMCIKTYLNLYGVIPSIEKLSEWSGIPYNMVLPVYKAEAAAAI